jgi:hypothetical protein
MEEDPGPVPEYLERENMLEPLEVIIPTRRILIVDDDRNIQQLKGASTCGT